MSQLDGNHPGITNSQYQEVDGYFLERSQGDQMIENLSQGLHPKTRAKANIRLGIMPSFLFPDSRMPHWLHEGEDMSSWPCASSVLLVLSMVND